MNHRRSTISFFLFTPPLIGLWLLLTLLVRPSGDVSQMRGEVLLLSQPFRHSSRPANGATGLPHAIMAKRFR